VTGVRQQRHGVAIRFEMIGLSKDRAIPIESEPVKNSENGVLSADFDPRPVEVFDAHDHPPTAFAGDEPVQDEGSQVPEMKNPGW
jgi:hypothetical protein